MAATMAMVRMTTKSSIKVNNSCADVCRPRPSPPMFEFYGTADHSDS